MTECCRCRPFGVCVCGDFLELADAPTPIDPDQGDDAVYVPTRTAG